MLSRGRLSPLLNAQGCSVEAGEGAQGCSGRSRRGALPCRRGGCWLLSIRRVSGLSAICRLSCIGGLGGSNRSSGGVVSTSAVPLDRLTVCLGGSWSRISSGRLSIRSCIGGLPVGCSGLRLGVADISGLSIGSITLLPICLGSLCISLSGLGGVSTVALLGCSLAVCTIIRGRPFLSFLLVLSTSVSLSLVLYGSKSLISVLTIFFICLLKQGKQKQK